MMSNCYLDKKINVVLGLFFVFLLPVQVTAAPDIRDRIDNIPPRATLAAPVASGPIGFNTFDVSSGKEVIYRTFYNEQLQIGDIVYEDVAVQTSTTPRGTNNVFSQLRGVSQRNLPHWISPAARLLARDWTTRQIYTTEVTSATERDIRRSGAPFDNSLNKWQRELAGGLLRSGENVINYTRGNRGDEFPNGGDDLGMRSRLGILGEIVNSGLFLVHYPKINDPIAKEPLSMLYVGANDGMLHAFNAKTGEEVFAYVPSGVFSNLKENTKLRVPGSVDTLLPKPAYVDGQIAVGKVSKSPGKVVGETLETVLVGTLGAGGEGLFALNVSDPYAGGDAVSTKQKANKIVKWEITGITTGYGNMGRIYGAPRLAVVNVDNVSKNVVIVGNGYYKGSVASLFIIDLDNGNLIQEIVVDPPTGLEKLFSMGIPYGLSTPTVHDDDADGVTDYVYAGDPGGKMWKFDLRNMKTSSPKRPVLLYKANAREGEIFDSIKTLPITTPPFVDVDENGKRMVIFGTGILTRPIQHITNLKNRLFGIHDRCEVAREDRTPCVDDNELDRVILRDGAMYGLANADYRYAVDGKRILNKNANTGGWFMSLIHGDRLLGFTPIARSGLLYFTTNTPTITNLFDPSWLHVIDMRTGLAPDSICSLFDRDQDGKFCEDKGNTEADLDDLLPIERIQDFVDGPMKPFFDFVPGDIIPRFVNLLARDRKLMGMKIKNGDKAAQGAVSQPTLLMNADGTVYPIFNWNTTGLQNTFDFTRKGLLALAGDKLRDSRYETEYNAQNGDTTIRYQMAVYGCKERDWMKSKRGVMYYGCKGGWGTVWLTASETTIKKDGSWHYRDKVGGSLRGGFGKTRCLANCTGSDQIAGVIGNRINSGYKTPVDGIPVVPQLQRRSWRVIEE